MKRTSEYKRQNDKFTVKYEPKIGKMNLLKNKNLKSYKESKTSIDITSSLDYKL